MNRFVNIVVVGIAVLAVIGTILLPVHKEEIPKGRQMEIGFTRKKGENAEPVRTKLWTDMQPEKAEALQKHFTLFFPEGAVLVEREEENIFIYFEGCDKKESIPKFTKELLDAVTPKGEVAVINKNLPEYAWDSWRLTASAQIKRNWW